MKYHPLTEKLYKNGYAHTVLDADKIIRAYLEEKAKHFGEQCYSINNAKDFMEALDFTPQEVKEEK